MTTPLRQPASDANLGTPSGDAKPKPTKSMLLGPSFDFNAATCEGLFIGISGLIGAGKTTLATALAKKLNLPVYYEPVVDNVYLEDFYTDMNKYAFPMQIYLLNKRYKQQQQIIWNNTGGVQDRTIYEDSVFASMLYQSGAMEERDYQTYRELFSSMSNFMRRPNLIVHLDLTPEESMRRIQERSRGCESGITLEYLTSLYNAYETFISEISRIIPVIKVDYSRFRTAEEMADAIAEEYSDLSTVRYVSWGKARSSARPNEKATDAKVEATKSEDIVAPTIA
jgi:deoxyadenosine kinase